MPEDIKARWLRLKTRQKAAILIAAMFILVVVSALLAPASPAPTDSVMDAKISALKAQTAALNAEAAAMNKLTDDLQSDDSKSKKPSWTILAATDPKWPFTVPKAVIRCEQGTSSAGGEVLTITANNIEYAFAFPMIDTGAYPLDTPILKPGKANTHEADMYMFKGAKKLCRAGSGH